ncbi:MAG TPA: homocysteine S-methyltransferase family protein [Desulfobacterales bacterium]
MKPIDIRQFFDQHPRILGEGAVIERLRRDGFELDPHVVNSAFIYDDTQRSAIEMIFREYLDIGAQYDLPLVLSTPTWRASRTRIEAAGYGNRDLNGDNFRFLDDLRQSYGPYAEKVVICGLLSCRGNAYNPAEALGVDEAYRFHSWQARRLGETGADFLLAATLPALSEATGLAAALAETGRPYVVSFVVRPEGTLLDGTPLKDALSAIEDAVTPGPLAFMANCTHASFLKSALAHPAHSSDHVRRRIIGLFANTAALTPEELDDSQDLVEEAPETFGPTVAGLHADFGLKILGGCCGTDDRHIRSLAQKLV